MILSIKTNKSMNTKEEIIQEGMQVWEEDQRTNPNPVNPHAFSYGYLHGVKKSTEQEAINFAKFLQGWESSIAEEIRQNPKSGEIKTIKELYQLYLKSKQINK